MKTVLIVEDDTDVRTTLGLALESENYDVLFAENGQVAINCLLERCYKFEPMPDLILLDMMMPVMDGLTFLQELPKQGHSQLLNIPVIVTTASRSQSVRNLKGISGYLDKPIDLDDLFSTIAACLLIQDEKTRPERKEGVEMQP